jgi:protease-4
MNSLPPERQPNVLVRLVRGAYRGLDRSRRFAMNLLFLLIVLIVLAAIAAEAPVIRDKTVLVLAPKGYVVEQYSSDPVDRALSKLFGEEVPEVQLRDILKALEAAAKDPHIDRVLVVPDEIHGAGLGTLREIGAALERFRKSGKEVVAYLEFADQRGYYLAAHADRVYVHPQGGVLLQGLDRYRTYFKDAFDKFGIEARLFRVGEYKSAGESWVRNSASPEAMEADRYWMDDLWRRYLEDVAARRKIDAAELAASIDGTVEALKRAGGDFAQLALDQKLVDAIKTRDEVREELIAKGAKDEKHHSFRQVDLATYVQSVYRKELPRPAEVAVVVAEGEITFGDQPPGTIGGDSTAKLLRDAREDEAIKAVVLRVDSPGGTVLPSELIRREVELTRASGKPVVVSMGDVAASGGYWISMDADEIVANPSTITGSIGIFGVWFNVPQLMAKIGLRTDGVATTWIAGAVDPTREYDPRLGEVFQSTLDKGYAQFVGKVAKAREKPVEEIDLVARGRVWSGAQALERGLVDRLGLLDDAIASAAKRAKLGSDYRVRYVEKEMTPFERFMADLSSSNAAALLRAEGVALPQAWLPERTVDELAALRRLVADVAKQKPLAIYAHCQCGLN